MASWKLENERQYRIQINGWTHFCSRGNTDHFNPTVSNIINFLAETFHRGKGYDCINTTRGAFSSLGIVVDGCREGNHSLICRFFCGVFYLRPSQTWNAMTWDIRPVLQQLRTMHPLQDLYLKDFTLKLVMLMTLATSSQESNIELSFAKKH